MSELGPEARDLMRAGRSAHRPTSVDRERIAQSLHARIEGASGVLPSATTLAGAGALGWPILSAIVVGLGAGGFFLATALRSEPAPSVPPPPSASVAAPAAPAVASTRADDHAVIAPAPPPAVEPPAQATEEPRVRARKQASDHLAKEVEILSRARKDLGAGRFAAAIRALDEHARKFPRGTLAQERTAARIQALCGLGRTSDADAELARLAPGSLHERRAREACAPGRKR
jgi:hypothetical protein